jgi:hypothetical protein
MNNGYMKRYPTPLIISECKLKPQLNTTSNLLRWLLSKRQKITSVEKDNSVEENPCTLLVGIQPFRKQYDGSS